MKKVLPLLILLALTLGIVSVVSAKDISFTQDDRDRLIRLETRLDAFEKNMDRHFTQIDKRFEQIDKRFEFMQNLMIGMLAVFGGLCGVFVGLLLWDRKTFKEKAKEEAVKALEKKGRIGLWLGAFEEYAQSNKELADILKKRHLMGDSNKL